MSCECVCHKVGLFGLLCCECTRRDLDEFVNGKPTSPSPPAQPEAAPPEKEPGLTPETRDAFMHEYQLSVWQCSACDVKYMASIAPTFCPRCGVNHDDPIGQQALDAIALQSCIHELAGEVEGHPTARHNFLQRVRQLRAMETENTRLQRLVTLYRAQADHALRQGFRKDVDSLGAEPSPQERWVPDAETLAKKMFERKFGVAKKWKTSLAKLVWIDKAKEFLAALAELPAPPAQPSPQASEEDDFANKFIGKWPASEPKEQP